jgi:hypothetical protein
MVAYVCLGATDWPFSPLYQTPHARARETPALCSLLAYNHRSLSKALRMVIHVIHR